MCRVCNGRQTFMHWLVKLQLFFSVFQSKHPADRFTVLINTYIHSSFKLDWVCIDLDIDPWFSCSRPNRTSNLLTLDSLQTFWPKQAQRFINEYYDWPRQMMPYWTAENVELGSHFILFYFLFSLRWMTLHIFARVLCFPTPAVPTKTVHTEINE